MDDWHQSVIKYVDCCPVTENTPVPSHPKGIAGDGWGMIDRNTVHFAFQHQVAVSV